MLVRIPIRTPAHTRIPDTATPTRPAFDSLRQFAGPSAPQWKQVQTAADELVPEVLDLFLDAVQSLRTQIELDLLEQFLTSGDTERTVAALPWESFEFALGTLEAPVFLALTKGATIEAIYIGDLVKAQVRFDLLNPKAVEWARQHSAEMVQQVSDATRAGVRKVIETAFLGGMSPRVSAKHIKQLVGLTEVHAQAVENYRAFLEKLALRDSLANLPESTIARLQRGGLRKNQLGKLARTGMTLERIDKLVEGYRDRLLKERALTIARHETLTASNQGQLLLWQQAIADGLLDAGMVRTWITVPDDRRCPVCKSMNGKMTGLNEPWHTPNGPVMVPQGIHVKCRCGQGLKKAEKGVMSVQGHEAYPVRALGSVSGYRPRGILLGGLSPRIAHLPRRHGQKDHIKS